MDNLIRHFRRQRGQTLQTLGDAIGLTPQSLSRIETGKMRLSTDWMERIAAALRVRPADLIEPPKHDGAVLIGEINAGGALDPLAPSPFRLALPPKAAQVVRLRENCGPYGAGEYLVCEPLPAAAFSRAVGHDCLIESPAGAMLARVTAITRPPGGRAPGPCAAALSPLNSGGKPIENQPITGLAPVRLVLRMVS